MGSDDSRHGVLGIIIHELLSLGASLLTLLLLTNLPLNRLTDSQLASPAKYTFTKCQQSPVNDTRSRNVGKFLYRFNFDQTSGPKLKHA